MTSEQKDDETLPVGATLNSRQMRILWIAVIVMGIMIIAALVAIVAKIIHEGSKLGKKKPATDGAQRVSISLPLAESASLALPAGSVVQSIALNGDRLAVHSRSPRGSEIAVVDLVTGKVISRVIVTSK